MVRLTCLGDAGSWSCRGDSRGVRYRAGPGDDYRTRTDRRRGDVNSYNLSRSGGSRERCRESDDRVCHGGGNRNSVDFRRCDVHVISLVLLRLIDSSRSHFYVLSGTARCREELNGMKTRQLHYRKTFDRSKIALPD